MSEYSEMQDEVIKSLESQLAEAREECIRLQQEINCLRMEPCQLPKCVEARAEIERLLKRFEERAPLIPDLQAKVHDLLHSDCCADDPRDGYKKIKAERDLLQSRCDRLEKVSAQAQECCQHTHPGSYGYCHKLGEALAQVEKS